MSGSDDEKFLEKIHEVFTGFDKNAAGKLEMNQLHYALSLLCIDLTAEEIQYACTFDEEVDSLTEEEFTKLIMEKIGNINCLQRLSESLSEFDEDASHAISRDKLKEILTMRGSAQLDDRDAERTLNDLPFDDSGYVDISALSNFVYQTEENGYMTEDTPQRSDTS